MHRYVVVSYMLGVATSGGDTRSQPRLHHNECGHRLVLNCVAGGRTRIIVASCHRARILENYGLKTMKRRVETRGG